ncbi:PglD-related sugar-binding protein [Algoriphagus resistens]|uniref:PglD-related sugar-binding protein n=1 Tax=Algoriphagus resistens TaxID=1750590 RepID=UPI0007169760|nr:DapH/DapD/GlmU-related protein [Algoriphagus resistens]
MVIVGAGGHGKEILFLLINAGYDPLSICFFDEDTSIDAVRWKERRFPVYSSKEHIKSRLESNSSFCLGVGNPILRRKFFDLFIALGGNPDWLDFSGVFGTEVGHGDLMPLTFVGPEVTIGTGVLINTGAQIHHESQVGEFSEIGPKAILLGGTKVGSFCRLGAGAIILPGVTLGDGVIVGAGSVVTKNCTAGQVLKGVPAKSNT